MRVSFLTYEQAGDGMIAGYSVDGWYVTDGNACVGPFDSREHAEVRMGETASLEVTESGHVLRTEVDSELVGDLSADMTDDISAIPTAPKKPRKARKRKAAK